MIVGIVLLTLLLAGFASSVSGAGDPDKGAGGGGTQSGEYHNGLLGEYYDSAEISNESALRAMRIDERISWSFGYESPLADLMPAFRMTPVNYSIRWSGYIQPDRTGLYVFKTLSDDGVRMTIDLGEGHETIIDSWGLLSLDYSSSEAMSLEEGRLYPFVLEFQQGPLYAAVHLFWEFEGVSLGIVPDTAFYVDQLIYNSFSEPQYLNYDFSGIGFRNKFYNADNEFDCEEVGNIDYDWGSGAPGDITTDVFVGLCGVHPTQVHRNAHIVLYRRRCAFRCGLMIKQSLTKWIGTIRKHLRTTSMLRSTTLLESISSIWTNRAFDSNGLKSSASE